MRFPTFARQRQQICRDTSIWVERALTFLGPWDELLDDQGRRWVRHGAAGPLSSGRFDRALLDPRVLVLVELYEDDREVPAGERAGWLAQARADLAGEEYAQFVCSTYRGPRAARLVLVTEYRTWCEDCGGVCRCPVVRLRGGL